MAATPEQRLETETSAPLSKEQSPRAFKWLLLVAALVVLPGLIALGVWQLQRADAKEALMQRWQQAPFIDLSAEPAVEYARISLVGRLDPVRWFLLDNRTKAGKAGYEVVALFRPASAEPEQGITPLLINLGWVAATGDRRFTPVVRIPTGPVRVEGYLTHPAKPLVLSGGEEQQSGWPKRIQSVEPVQQAQQLETSLQVWLVQLSVPVLAETELNWQPAVIPAEKHLAYAVQWFAMAAALAALIGWHIHKLRKEGIGI